MAAWAGASVVAPPVAHAEPARSSQRSVADWNALRARLRGRVVLPDEADYPTAKQIFNTRFDDQKPAAIVQVDTAEDVATAVSFAAHNGLKLAARSGGHSYAGVSAGTGVMIVDLRKLSGATYRDNTVTVGPATTLYAVYAELDKAGQTIPTGMCPDVGAAGLTLGGGLGFESRKHGLTCDHLIGATMVLPDGSHLEVSAATEPELLWGLRGGGSLLGVVTSLTYDTVASTRKDLVRLVFPGQHAVRCILGWVAWLARDTGRDAWCDVSLDADGTGGLRCWMQLVCPEGTGLGFAAAMMQSAAVVPVHIERQTMSHMQVVDYLAGGGPTQARAGFTNGSDVVTEMSEAAAAAVVDAITAHSARGGTGWVQINPLDGAVADIAPDGTAFPWRRHAALVEWGAYEPIPHAVAADWITAAHARVAEYSAGGYGNYLESGTPTTRYFGDNRARLDRIRDGIDPHRRIHTVLTDPAPPPGPGH
ncbi:FAD-binding oxidoreductase [Nocardia pseudobrasiliensis]|uniref:FAD/FMN-containing dehydrogenase n=1 Tax=Nocardia pseudobrasiliensis TaxID=45979 RepID=A0A370HYZ1_9NOCA|nr:FAD-binding oxidoreductase [Nocardia pseudobrasiliensis]RDI63727.1 FAD/FMN-containing dehydrogenase [Nocardia pseudobrasiliensis]